MRALYLSHIGMTEPLGQSQVLPYLTGLADAGAKITIVSFEARTASREALESLRARLEGKSIEWRPFVRSASHGLHVKAYEASRAIARGLALSLRTRPDIIHARSYLPSAMADVISKAAPGSKLLFDCRGLLGDEYADWGHWRRDGLNYRALKMYERRLFARTDGLIVLTNALRRWLAARGMPRARAEVEVIPCCVDTARFVPDEATRRRVRAELGLGDRLTIVYSGSVASWYMDREMAKLVGFAKRIREDVAFLVLTPSPTDQLQGYLEHAGLAPRDVIVRSVAPARMPEMLCAADLGLSFITPSFSKIGSSPTKVAEYLACGVPVVLNGGIGDQDDLAAEKGACVVIPSFEDRVLEDAAPRGLALASRPYAERALVTREAAERHFSLSRIGVPRYTRLYASLCR